MILSGSKSVASYDPRDGSRHWIIDGPTEQFVASMVYNGELLFMTGGFPDHHMLAIRPDGHGNVTDTHVAWRTTENASYVPSPIVAGEYFLVVSDGGIASCFEAKTGKRAWKERIGRRTARRWCRPADWSTFSPTTDVTTVVRPGPQFDRVAENELGEDCYCLAGHQPRSDLPAGREAPVLHRDQPDRGAIEWRRRWSQCTLRGGTPDSPRYLSPNEIPWIPSPHAPTIAVGCPRPKSS